MNKELTDEQKFEIKSTAICLNVEEGKLKGIVPSGIIKKLKDTNNGLQKMLDRRQDLINGLDLVEGKIFQLQNNVKGMSSIVSELMKPEFMSEELFNSLVIETEEISQKKQPENKRVENTNQALPSSVQQENITTTAPTSVAGSVGKKGLIQQ